ncbi:MAG: peptidoglycan DD-metalloendopeptidase family protein [Hyphomicrobiaceae bacterium]|nr:MAG: peptidoglycan DD-metalloendopeptidase family protein [Hyphomicrobiaceae bacterium]
MLRITTGAWIAAAAAAAVPLLALAQGSLTPEDARKRVDADRSRLEATQRRSKELQADMDKIAAERERINARLVETGKLIQQSEAQLSLIESRLGELETQENHLRGSLEQRHGSISALLAAMQRMGRNPPPVMVTRREDALSMVRSAMLLAAAFPELRGQALALAEQLNDLVRVMTSIRTEGDRLRAETVRLNDARTRLAGLQETKRQSLAERQGELAQLRRTAEEIGKNIDDLSELIGKLDREVASKTGLGTYEQEMAAAKQRPTEAARPQQPGDRGSSSAVVLAPTGDRVAMLTPGRIKPAMPFVEAKGLLPLPAQGRRVLTFGDKTQYGSQSKGLVIETRHGGQVISPADGWIVYAGGFRSYGQLLIINAGGGYHFLLAGLSQIDVQLGQFVLAGEPVGVMSAAAKSPQAKAQDNAPVLYIELRKDQRPIDPDPWWSDASRKVQG